MRWRRRTTYVVVDPRAAATNPGAVDETAVKAFYREVLTELRPDTTQVVADLFGRTGPLPPEAQQAALTLHQLIRPPLLATIDRNPFQGVVINDCDSQQWEALLTIAPYASHLSLEGGGLFRDLFTSSGSLDSVRARLLPEQYQRIAAALVAVAAPEIRPRR